jgi:hypothetical protein
MVLLMKLFGKNVSVSPTPNLVEDMEQRKHLFLSLGREEGGVDFISAPNGDILPPSKPILLALIGGYFQNQPGGIRIRIDGKTEEFGQNTDQLLGWKKTLKKPTTKNRP